MRQKFGYSIVGLVSIAVALLALGIGSEALAKNNAAKKAAKGQMIKGKIESVENGTLTVLTKDNGSQKVQLTSDTLYRRQDGKKGTAAAIAQTDLKAGQHVKVSMKGDKAKVVDVEEKTKAGKKKNAA